MTLFKQFGLGTVQFGSNYGISNRAGQPSEVAVAEILSCAAKAGVGYIDTASGYGVAESLVGRYWPEQHSVRIISKTPPIPDAEIEDRHRKVWLDEIAKSLERLKRDRIHGVLVHRVADLQKPGWQHLVEALQQAQQCGWTTQIGVSVYNGDQLELAESRFRLELVQLPLNVLDRRMIENGALARLKAAGAEMHVRSVFLQGLLLMPSDTLPEFFDPIRAHVAELHRRWAAHGLSPLEGCMGFVLNRRDVDAIIVGVSRRSEFEDIVAAVTKLTNLTVDVGSDAAVDPIYLDPSRWP